MDLFFIILFGIRGRIFLMINVGIEDFTESETLNRIT